MKPSSRPNSRVLRRIAISAAITLACLFVGTGSLQRVFAQASCLMSFCQFLPFIGDSPTRSPQPVSTRTPTRTTAPATPTASATPTATATTSPYLFHDEFDGTSIDESKWTLGDEMGDPTNDEEECYQPENVSVAGGSLVLTSRRSAAPISCPASGQGNVNTRYTSGLAQWKSFSLRYGIIEFRVRTPAASGQWPAIWLLGANCQSTTSSVFDAPNCAWPVDALSSAEIDILEQFGNPKRNNMMIHNGNNPDSDAFANGCPLQDLDFDNSVDFHTYRLIWEPGKATWQIDGVTKCVSTDHVPANPMFLRINLAVGGGGGPIDNGAFPESMEVDYVRVYRLP